MKKLTEIEKLKYWLDAEFSILHVMFAIVMLELTSGWFATTLLVVYLIFTLMYALTRIAYVFSFDKDYLRVPKK